MIRKYFYGLQEISRQHADMLDGEGVVVCNYFDREDFQQPIVVENDLVDLPRCAHKMHSFVVVGKKNYRLLEFTEKRDVLRYNRPYRSKIALVMDDKYRVCILDLETGKRLFGVENKYKLEIVNENVFVVGGGKHWMVVNREGKRMDETKNGAYQINKDYLLKIEHGAEKNNVSKIWLKDLENKQLGGN